MTETAPMKALRATHAEARAGREAAEALAPLLALLDPLEGEGDPLEEVRILLQTIVQTQERTLQAIEVLASRLAPSRSTPAPNSARA